VCRLEQKHETLSEKQSKAKCKEVLISNPLYWGGGGTLCCFFFVCLFVFNVVSKTKLLCKRIYYINFLTLAVLKTGWPNYLKT
jgi:hypothetical protein